MNAQMKGRKYELRCKKGEKQRWILAIDSLRSHYLAIKNGIFLFDKKVKEKVEKQKEI